MSKLSALIVIVDGCNENYIAPELMPFVYSLKQRGSYSRMSVTPSFAHRLELFTGLAPSTTNTFVAFCYDPEIQPFRWLGKLLVPKRWHTGCPDIGWVLRIIHRIRRGVWANFEDVSLLTATYYALTKTWIDFGRIPLRLLPHLTIDESTIVYQQKERLRTQEHLFGILSHYGFNVRFIYGDVNTVETRVAQLNRSDRDVWILHYGDSDKIGHRFGPNSLQIKTTLQAIDRSIQGIYSTSGDYIDFLLLLTDHDMVEIQQDLNLWSQLEQLKARLIQDYLVFLNSPVAHFWFKTREAEVEIGCLLQSLHAYGRVISKAELAARNMPIHERYGHVIFWARPGVNIWPNFYHRTSFRGVHSYFDHDGNVPLLLCHHDRGAKLAPSAKLRDIAPTVLELLDIPRPPMDGRSLLVKR